MASIGRMPQGTARVRRSHCEVVQEILTLCERRNTKTLIMHDANLSHTIMERYLHDLEARGVISHVNDERGFALTDRGEELLQLLRRVHTILREPADAHDHHHLL